MIFQSAWCVIILLPGVLDAQTLQLGANWHHVDHSLKLAVCNQDVEILNLLYHNGADAVELENELYYFNQTIEEFSVGHAYTVIRNGTAYQFYFTDLPVLSVEMISGEADHDRRPAKAVFSEPTGQIVQSDIGVNLRGGYSQYLPKKSLRIEFWADSTGNPLNTSLLDLRSDDDWILLPMYNEPLRVRNATGHRLWELLHSPYYADDEPNAQSGVRFRYIELFWNDQYRGVYLLTERVDRKLLKLDHYQNNDTLTSELYKGAEWGMGIVAFEHTGLYSNTEREWDGFELKYPKSDMMTEWSNLFDFAAFILESPDSIFVQQVNDRFNLTNAADYFIFLNLLSAIDNSGKNLFVARRNVDEPYFYVPWDLDGILGNDPAGDRIGYGTEILTNGLYERLLHNCEATGFDSLLFNRWAELRSGLLSTYSLETLVSENLNRLLVNGVLERESMAWPDYHYNPDDMDYLHDWLAHRIDMLDDWFDGPCQKVRTEVPEISVSFNIFPNPSVGKLCIEHRSIPENTSYSIFNSHGQQIMEDRLRWQFTIIDLSELPSGMYYMQVGNDNNVLTRRWVKL